MYGVMQKLKKEPIFHLHYIQQSFIGASKIASRQCFTVIAQKKVAEDVAVVRQYIEESFLVH